MIGALPSIGFWRGRKVLITGHTGFKGSWLTLWLHSLGADICGLALPPPHHPNLFETARVDCGIDHRVGDIRDLEVVRSTVAEAQPDIILHLAAQALVRASYNDPIGTYATNVMGTLHVLEAARQCPATRAVVVVTSDKCYENREWVWGYRETEPMGGHDPYSNSKGCAELVVDAYRRSFMATQGQAVASARAGNVIGGGDWAEDRLVPDALRAFLVGQPVVLRNPQAIRPWQHVLDPLSGYLLLAERLIENPKTMAESWNFGPSGERDWYVSEVISRLATLWGEGATWQVENGDQAHPHEAGLLKLDVSKARSLLGWTGRLDLNQSLRMTVDWAKAYRQGQDMRTFTLEQIAQFSTSTFTEQQSSAS